jgi:hypothetical protein
MTYQEWFNQFQKQLAQEAPDDYHATFINMNRPEDRNRIYVMGNNGLDHILPETGPITDAHKEQMFNLAKDGKLFVFPLSGSEPLQADVKDGNTLNVLEFNSITREYDKDVEEPQPVKFGFLKRLLNSVFGFFKEDKQRYDTYLEQLQEYRRDCQVENYVDWVTDKQCRFPAEREREIQCNNENWRRYGREALENAHKELSDPNITPWKKAAFQVKEQVTRGIVDGNANYSDAEVKEMVVTLAVYEQINKQPELADICRENPEQLQALHDIFGASKCIAKMMEGNKNYQGGMLAPCVFGDKLIGEMLKDYSVEVRDRRTVADMLIAEGKIEPIGNDMAGVKELFLNEKITERFVQLDNARNRIPREELKVEVINHNGKKEIDYIGLNFVKLDDPRVQAVIDGDKANEAQQAKNLEATNIIG